MSASHVDLNNSNKEEKYYYSQSHHSEDQSVDVESSAKSTEKKKAKSLPLLARLTNFGRLVLAGGEGFMLGLVKAAVGPFIVPMLDQPINNRFSFLKNFLLMPIIAISFAITTPFIGVFKALKAELKKQRSAGLVLAEASSKPSESEGQPSPSVLAAFLGLIVGLVKAPFVGFHALYNTPKQQRNESLVESLIRAPFRLLAAMLSSVVQTTLEWGKGKPKAEKSALPTHAETGLKTEAPAYLPQTVFGWLRVAAFAITGFLLGCFEAGFAAVDQVLEASKNDSLLVAFVKAPFRLLEAFGKHIFSTAAAWAKDESEAQRTNKASDFIELPELDSSVPKQNPHNQKTRFEQFLFFTRFLLNALGGFLAGCIKAVPFALSSVLLSKSQEENLPTFIFKAPYRLVKGLINSPLHNAVYWVNAEKRNWIAEEAAKSSQPYANSSKISGLGGYLFAGIKGLAGLVAGVFYGLYVLAANKNNDSWLKNIIKAPIRYLNAIFEQAAKWARPKERKASLEFDAKVAKSHNSNSSNSNHQIHQGLDEYPPQQNSIPKQQPQQQYQGQYSSPPLPFINRPSSAFYKQDEPKLKSDEVAAVEPAMQIRLD